MGPYTEMKDLKEISFMNRLKANGKIDHNVMSFFVNDQTPGMKSHLKLGNTDTEAYLGELNLLKTQNLGSWKIKGTYFMYDNVDLSRSDTRSVLIEPSLPYIYIPDNDFKIFAEHLSKKYKHIICRVNKGYCKINKACSQETEFIDWEINIALEDGRRLVSLKVTDKRGSMLINGPDVGDVENTCYVPVFRSQNNQDTWFLGGLFLSQYYVVFDMTPYDEYNQDYI